VLGSNQRRLSRRFYSTLLLSESPPADQNICASRRDFGPPPSAMRPWAPDSAAVRATDGCGGSTDEEGRATDGCGKIHGRRGQERYPDRLQERYADRPTGLLPLTWHFRIPIHYHHLPRRRSRFRSRTRTRTRTRWPLLHPSQQSRFPMKRPLLSGTSVVAVARVGWVSDVGARDTGR
jgi:hypothetical protein